MIWHILWVTLVALALIAVVRWGYRTTVTGGGVVIATAALIWGFFRPDDRGWFLYRPIGWGWISLLFVLLLLSVVVAFFKWRLAKLIGLIAVFFAVLAPFWDIFTAAFWRSLWPGAWDISWSHVLWTLVVVGLVVAIILALLKFFAVAGVIAAIAAVTAVLLIGFSMADLGDSHDEVATHEPSASSSPSPSPSASPSEEETTIEAKASCANRFEQKLDPNKRYRFVSEGFEGTAKQKRRQLVSALGHDYRYLDFFAEQLFHKSYKRGSLVTADRSCLSDKGSRLHAKVEGALMASGTKTALAPRDGFNTGMVDGRAVVGHHPGIYGNRQATYYTLTDGTLVIVLDRCGNLSLPSKPKDLPSGKTDNTTPKRHRQTSPTTHSQPSGSGGASTPTSKPSKKPTLKPKSSDPKDYTVEEGAPKATVSEPATQPSAVETQSTGGRGVSDTPSNEPGSESGVQAPGADPAPTASASPQPPQDTANDPSNGASSCAPPPGETEC
jgi:hypothetical protein